MSQKLSIEDAAIIRQVLKDALPKMKTQSLKKGVCFAVRSTRAREEHKKITKSFVHAGLEGHGWVTGWLLNHSPEYKEEYIKAYLGDDDTLVKFLEKVRQYRIDWIHHMIGNLDAYIKSKGKTSL